MKNNYYLRLLLLSAFTMMILTNCKKETPQKQDTGRHDQVTGNWKQKDLIISVSVKLGGQTIPAGSSMITLAPLLGQALKNPAITEGLVCTKNNVYSFTADGTYTITGCTDLILPKAGNTGKWELAVYDAVVQLSNPKGEVDPHWINSINSNKMQLALTLSITGVGNLPLSLILEKQ